RRAAEHRDGHLFGNPPPRPFGPYACRDARQHAEKHGSRAIDQRLIAAQLPGGQSDHQPEGQRAADQRKYAPDHDGLCSGFFFVLSRFCWLDTRTRWTNPSVNPRTAPTIVPHGSVRHQKSRATPTPIGTTISIPTWPMANNRPTSLGSGRRWLMGRLVP